MNWNEKTYIDFKVNKFDFHRAIKKGKNIFLYKNGKLIARSEDEAEILKIIDTEKGK